MLRGRRAASNRTLGFFFARARCRVYVKYFDTPYRYRFLILPQCYYFSVGQRNAEDSDRMTNAEENINKCTLLIDSALRFEFKHCKQQKQ